MIDAIFWETKDIGAGGLGVSSTARVLKTSGASQLCSIVQQVLLEASTK